MSRVPPGAEDPRFIAAVDLIGRTGAESFQIRYSDDPEPVVWMAVASYEDEQGLRAEVAAGMTPLTALMRLVDVLVDGGLCAHCHRVTAVSDDWTATFPEEIVGNTVCWYIFDPETKTFRRSCEGDT